MQIESSKLLIKKLDLEQHIDSLCSFFAREKPIQIPGDRERAFKYIQALEKLDFPTPVEVDSFNTTTSHLKRFGTLTFEQIFELIKVVRYFQMMNSKGFSGIIGEWMSSFVVPEKFLEIEAFFDEKGNFIENLDEQIEASSLRIKQSKDEIAGHFKRVLHSSKLRAYLVDSQVHYLNSEECLLVRSGFNHVLRGSVVGRSSAGFFFVTPESIIKSKQRLREQLRAKESLLYEYAKRFSTSLSTLLPFINYIDKEFDRFDHYSARVLFARSSSLHIVCSQKTDDIILSNFIHPALKNPKSISLKFTSQLLMITGVNAGGKTILLKSILASVFMAKYLIPMKLNPTESCIGEFKQIEAIIDDPQNVKNDISTFAGRMREFSALLKSGAALVGVDEIELGTDSDEAAALFKVILDEMIKRGQKIVLTTHHKRLASLMAGDRSVELIAAMYDEKNRVPTYEFLQGIIGKSYAFETALRYGIDKRIVTASKELYGEQHEKLNLLIERGSELERELKSKVDEVSTTLQSVKTKEQELQELKRAQLEEFDNYKNSLHTEFKEAIDSAKKAAKAGDKAAIHRAMNRANEKLPKLNIKQDKKHSYSLKVGDSVKYRNHRATITHIKTKEATIITDDGLKMRVKTDTLKPVPSLPKKRPKVEITNQVERRSGLKLDLHGMRQDEACEVMDKFISDALIQGWDEVTIYHGIGEGKLSYAVKKFLEEHPSVIKFEDAPPQLGGFGAKIVWL